MATVDDMIKAHLTWLRAGGYSPNTIDTARKVLRHLHRDLPCGIHEALESELADWLAAYSEVQNTVCTYSRAIRRFYGWATRETDPWMTSNPAAGLPVPKTPEGLPRPADDDLVFRACTEPDMPWLLCCRLTALAGLRPCEISRLRREHITVEVIMVIMGKGRKDRPVPTHPDIWTLVEDMPPGLVVTRPKGGQATPGWISVMAPRHLRLIGIDTTLYPLRHWFGTETADRYKNVRVVQQLMGHASLNTTARYTKVKDEQLRRAVAALPRFSADVRGSAAAPDRLGEDPATPMPPRGGGSGYVGDGRGAPLRSRALPRRLRRSRP